MVLHQAKMDWRESFNMPKTEFQLLAEAIAKSGDIQPGSLSIGGVLRPQQATRIIDLLVDSAEILKMVTVERSSKLSKEVDVLEVKGKVLTRIPQGNEPDEFTGIANVGRTLEMKAHQLFGRVLFDALRDNQGDPQYENKVLGQWIKRWSRDIACLAFTGTHDDYVKNDAIKGKFERLNVGWPQILKTESTSRKVNNASFRGGPSNTLDYVEYLDAIVSSLPDEYKSGDCRIIMSKTDHERYIKQSGQGDGGVGYLIKGGVKEFLGYEIIPQQNMPLGEVIFTPLPNLVYGINTEVERYREVSGRRRCVFYTFDANDDFEVAIPGAAVIGYAS